MFSKNRKKKTEDQSRAAHTFYNDHIQKSVMGISCLLYTSRICICHGLAGRILIMKKYLEQHKNPEFREIYNQKVQELFFILEQKDDLNASETRNPAFMNGISGVAYALLKLYTEMK